MAKITQRTKNQITDVAVNTAFDGNQLYREEAQKLTQDFLTSFGIFVGFYNKVNNTTMSVEDALHNDDMLPLYFAMSNDLKEGVASTTQNNTTAIVPVGQPNYTKRVGKPKSTKRLSYEQFQVENGTSVAHAIYKEMRKQGQAMSRIEIARALNIRLSTVCGQIFAMEEAGLVQCVGTKVDPDSNRKVELLIAR